MSENSQTETDNPEPIINISEILSKKAMIARLYVGGWSGRVTDKIITDELTDMKGAKKGTTSVTKAIIDKKHFKDIRDAVSRMKRFHNEETMPWDQNGGRLLPTTQFAAYNLQFRQCIRDLNEAVDIFVTGYTSYIDEAEESLGDMFNRSDYIPINEIKAKFMLDVNFEKVPESGDFRVDIPESEQDRIRESITQQVENQHTEAMKRIWVRIYKAIEHMNIKLSEENGVFRDSLVGNIEQLIRVLPSLNISDDPRLTEMTTEMQTKLCGYSAEDLRRNKVLRKDIVEETDEIIEKMKQMEDIFGPATVGITETSRTNESN